MFLNRIKGICHLHQFWHQWIALFVITFWYCIKRFFHYHVSQNSTEWSLCTFTVSLEGKVRKNLFWFSVGTFQISVLHIAKFPMMLSMWMFSSCPLAKWNLIQSPFISHSCTLYAQKHLITGFPKYPASFPAWIHTFLQTSFLSLSKGNNMASV